MTFEHKIVMGLEEIKGIVFECNTNACKSKITIAPDNANIPPKACPNGHAWDWNTALGYQSTESPFIAFLSSVNTLRNPMRKDVGFKIFLEFDNLDFRSSDAD